MMTMASCGTGVAYSSRNVLADPELREAIKKFSSWPTIPQVLRPAKRLFAVHEAWRMPLAKFLLRTCLAVAAAIT